MIQEDPASQIQQALVNEMRLRPPQDIDPQQIRTSLDMSGQLKGFMGITVSASDLGGHEGLPGRILIDVKVSVTAWTHIDEDADGSICDALASDIRQLMPTLNDSNDDWTLPPLDGWAVRFPGIIQASESMLSPDGVYRVKEITATMYLQNTHF